MKEHVISAPQHSSQGVFLDRRCVGEKGHTSNDFCADNTDIARSKLQFKGDNNSSKVYDKEV